MYKGAVFFDFDGTLTDETVGINTPTPKTILALERLRANGYATFLTTGRMKALTTLVSGKFTGLVTSNGAYSEVDGKTISNLYIDKEILSKAVAYMEKENICYYHCCSDSGSGGFCYPDGERYFRCSGSDNGRNDKGHRSPGGGTGRTFQTERL